MDDMMEEERKRALQDAQKKREQDWAHKKKYATKILEQVEENEKQRLKELERLQRVRKNYKVYKYLRYFSQFILDSILRMRK